MSGYQPFSQDVRSHGRFIYTGSNAPLSAQIANKQQSRLIFDSISCEPTSILDIGCGDGTYTAEIAEKYSKAKVLGFDPSTDAISVASSMWGDTITNLEFTSDLRAFSNVKESIFDLAVIRGVLHHSENPAELVAQACKAARYVVILEPNGLNLGLKLIEKLSRYHRNHGERSFTKWRIESWINQAGGTLQHAKIGVLVPFFCPAPMARILLGIQGPIEKIKLLRWLVCGAQVFYIKNI